jgi:hypothetical protein
MAVAIISIIKESGSCVPRDLEAKGHTPEDIVRCWWRRDRYRRDMERIEVFDTTDVATVHELAGNPEIELDITRLYNDNGISGLPKAQYNKLPDHIRAKLVTRHRRLVMPNTISCADIISYSRLIVVPMLERAGNILAPCAGHIAFWKLVEVENIDARDAKFVSLPKLERAGMITCDGEIYCPVERYNPDWHSSEKTRQLYTRYSPAL